MPTKFEGFSVEELEEAFDRIKDREDWRNPIRCWVRPEHMEITMAAIRFYTATEPVTGEKDKYGRTHVRSEGYRNGPAGP